MDATSHVVNARELLHVLDQSLGSQHPEGSRSRRIALVQLLLSMHREQEAAYAVEHAVEHAAEHTGGGSQGEDGGGGGASVSGQGGAAGGGAPPVGMGGNGGQQRQQQQQVQQQHVPQQQQQHQQQQWGGVMQEERMSLPLALAHLVIAELDYEELYELFGGMPACVVWWGCGGWCVYVGTNTPTCHMPPQHYR